jgi:hypothetical protein
MQMRNVIQMKHEGDALHENGVGCGVGCWVFGVECSSSHVWTGGQFIGHVTPRTTRKGKATVLGGHARKNVKLLPSKYFGCRYYT